MKSTIVFILQLPNNTVE